MATFLQFRLLIWKSLITSLRSPLWILLEILIPYFVLRVIDTSPNLEISQSPPRRIGRLSCGDITLDELFHARGTSEDRKLTEFFTLYPACRPDENTRITLNELDTNKIDVRIHSSNAFTFQPSIIVRNQTTASDFDYSITNHDEIMHVANLIGTLMKSATNLTRTIQYENLPQPKGQGDIPRQLANYSTILYLTLIPMLITINIGREIATERESKMKDYLHVMGLHRSVYFTHHFAFAFMKTLPSIISSGFLLNQIFNGFCLAVLFMGFVSAQISTAILISSIVQKPSLAIIAIVVAIPSTTVISYMFPVLRSSVLKSMLACFNPSHALELGIDCLKEFELRGSVILLTEFYYALPIGAIVCMLLLDTGLYLYFAIRIDSFISKCTFRDCFFVKVHKEEEGNKKELNIHQDMSSNLIVDIELAKVTKIFPTGERAVKNVDMSIYKGQTTVLLGHNGAGKSTTFSMIAGMINPTTGNIRIGSTEEDITVGFCPQYDPVFPKLTVKEHLHFFATLRGVHEWRKEGERLLDTLAMYEKRNKLSMKISGGARRKLSVAIAMIGKSSIVLLDEPTVGVDTNSRRDIERLMISEKGRRTMLLTTHYTDEAEAVGDRVLIMAGGRVVCSGSPHFLINQFGTGHKLTCAVDEITRPHEAAMRTLKIVKKYSEAVLEREHGMVFDVHLEKKSNENFPDMFRELEADKHTLGLDSFGLTNSSLEQVFLRVGEMTSTTESADIEESLQKLMKQNDKRLKFPAKSMQQFAVLCYKRALYEKASFSSVLSNLVGIAFLVFLFSIILGVQRGTIRLDRTPSAQVFDLLSFPDCGRIGVDKALVVYKQVVEQFRDKHCIEVEDFTNFLSWYEDYAMEYRPAIIAAIGRNLSSGEIVVHVPPSDRRAILPIHYGLVRALTGAPHWSKEGGLRMTAIYNYTKIEGVTESEPDVDYLLSGDKFAFALIAILILPVVMYRIIGFYVLQKSINFDHQQLLTGVPRSLYWFSCIFSDIAMVAPNYVILCVSCVLFGLQQDIIIMRTPHLVLTILISLFKIYLLKRFFRTKSKAENYMMLFFMVSLALTLICMKYEDNHFTHSSAPKIDFYYDYVLYLDPSATILAPMLFSRWTDYEPRIHHFLLVQLFTVLSAFFVMKTYTSTKRRMQKAADAVLFPEEYVPKESRPEVVLEVIDLKKQHSKWGLVVKGISFQLTRGACFGLLGTNGAGKTTTLDVLTGRTVATYGRATVNDIDCATPANLGYCPQSDPLMGMFTGRQHLAILASLHGYSNPAAVIGAVLACLGMTSEADRRCDSYSGGERRKISVAAAMLAQHSLIVMDEPTAGIDPVTRRDIWSVISALRELTRTAIVLTSHSMNEVEALCSRVAIMKAGIIANLSTPQRLKMRHGSYFKLTLLVEGLSHEQTLRKVRSTYPPAQLLVGTNTGAVVIGIPRESSMQWSTVFEECMELADAMCAVDFWLAEASLEDVFIYLTRDRRRRLDFLPRSSSPAPPLVSPVTLSIPKLQKNGHSFEHSFESIV